MQLGVSSYTWTWAVGVKGQMPAKPLDAFGLLDKAKELDVSVLQIADNPALHELSQATLEQISARAQEYGITLEVGTRGIRPQHLLKYLEIAKTLGSKFVRTITHEVDDQALTQIHKVLSKYEAADVALAFENHDEHKTERLAEFLDRIGSKYVGVCLDTVNSFAALEAPDQVIKNLAPYVLSLHVKDFDIVRVKTRPGLLVEGRAAGDGRLNIPWTIEYLKQQGKDPNAILELWVPSFDTLEETIRKEDEWARKSIAYLKTIIK
jgi:sugar phosphate isomerase/epimerase